MASNSKRIAKNTLLLYFRSIIMMIIAIYTSRVLLATLGIDNYGIYNVVGGVVAMFTSIKSVLASSVQRYLNYYKGKEDVNKVQEVFNTSIIIHFALAIVFSLVIEFIGVWFVKDHLLLPNGSLDVALFVFHCSVIAVLFTILTIPYDSAVIANEHMHFYAYISIADSVFKLFAVFLLPYLPLDYLKSYSILVLFITLLLRVITIIYCRRFDECRFKNIFNKALLKNMTSFAGWNFLGCTASSLIEEGSNFILNAFGGVVANAARGIAYQIRSAINLISGNIVVASQPFIMQQAGVVDKDKFFNYIFLQTRLLFYIISITCLPLFIYCEDILQLWLKNVPEYTLSFTRSILIYMVIMSFQKSIDIAFKSYGVMAKYQIIDTSIALLTLPAAYFVLYLGYPLHYAFYAFSFVRIIDYIAVLILANKQIQLPIKQYASNVIIPCLKATIIVIILGLFFMSFMKNNNVITLIIYPLLVVVIAAFLYILLVLDKSEKELVKTILNKISK